MRITRLLALALLLAACSGADAGPGPVTPPPAPAPPAPPPPPPDTALRLRLEVVAEGLANPLHLTAPPGDPRLFVVEKPGRIRVIRDGRLLERPFLDIAALVSRGGEQGLLGLAFHPRYASNGFFYVNYTDLQGDTRVVRYRVGGEPDVADTASAREILSQRQPFSNHNGGLVAFGPDGMLYIGLGDGGSAGDPQGNGQSRATLLGKILRIDVDRGDPYAVPQDNPFARTAGARGEIWAYGLRNPWRFAFDPPAGLLYVADVGQNLWEEVNVARATEGGLNYGWNVMEGRHCFRAASCDMAGLVMPAFEYSHSEAPGGCSVTGGHVYRGSAIPALAGHYFFSDYCAGWLRSFRYADGAAAAVRTWDVGVIGSVLSFGADAAGELYVLTGGGRVLRLAAR